MLMMMVTRMMTMMMMGAIMMMMMMMMISCCWRQGVYLVGEVVDLGDQSWTTLYLPEMPFIINSCSWNVIYRPDRKLFVCTQSFYVDRFALKTVCVCECKLVLLASAL